MGLGFAAAFFLAMRFALAGFLFDLAMADFLFGVFLSGEGFFFLGIGAISSISQ